uniref:Serpentine Receptor, class V n=1 Tax=Steinernema glaseri TaxID=37863 RepID=A0A1I7Y5A5_9BILA
MTLLSSTAFYIIAIPLSAMAACLNLRLFFIFFKSTGGGKRHYSTLFLTLFVHLFFNVMSISYSVACLLGIFQGTWNPLVILWTGSCTFASVSAMGTCNCCISIDRIIAMRRPILYGLKYARWTQVATVVLMIATFTFSSLRHHLAFVPPMSNTPAFNTIIATVSLRQAALIKTIVSSVNLVLTVIFLRETRVFLRKLQNTQIHRSIKAANQVVILQVAVEALLMVFPDVIAVPLSFFDISLPTIIGSFPTPLCAAYTFICALLLTLKVRKEHLSQNISVVTSKSG